MSPMYWMDICAAGILTYVWSWLSFNWGRSMAMSLNYTIKSTCSFTRNTQTNTHSLHHCKWADNMAVACGSWSQCVCAEMWSWAVTLLPLPPVGSAGPRGPLGVPGSACLTGRWKEAERGVGSCQPASYCEAAVPRPSTHPLSGWDRGLQQAFVSGKTPSLTALASFTLTLPDMSLSAEKNM